MNSDEVNSPFVPTSPKNEYDINIEMWKHYDNLRQDKNKTFLAANSILAAAVGLALRGGEPDSGFQIVALLVALVGFLACVLWFLLLSRNAAYIRYHRDRASALELSAGHSTFDVGWKEFEKRIPPWERVSSNLTDRLLTAVLAAFWTSLVIYFLTAMLCFSGRA
jgi:hypothetical protein